VVRTPRGQSDEKIRRKRLMPLISARPPRIARTLHPGYAEVAATPCPISGARRELVRRNRARGSGAPPRWGLSDARVAGRMAPWVGRNGSLRAEGGVPYQKAAPTGSRTVAPQRKMSSMHSALRMRSDQARRVSASVASMRRRVSSGISPNLRRSRRNRIRASPRCLPSWRPSSRPS